MLPMNLGAPPLMMGPPTPEMLETMYKIKVCVIGIFIAAVGLFCTGENVPFNECICGIVGVFMLKDDESLATCYACLINSPLSQCTGPSGGGLGCVMPFVFIASFNCIFLALRLFTGGPFLLISFIFQFSGAFFAWKLNGLVSAEAFADLGGGGLGQGPGLSQPLAQMRMFSGQQGLDQQGPTTGLLSNQGAGPTGGLGASPGQPGTVPPAGRFQAFQGSGQRLTD